MGVSTVKRVGGKNHLEFLPQVPVQNTAANGNEGLGRSNTSVSKMGILNYSAEQFTCVLE